MITCKACGKDFREIKGAKYCPFCGKLLQPYFSTKEQDSFLIEHNNMLRKDLTELFNKHFGTNKTVSAIQHRCSRLGLELPKEVRYAHYKDAPTKLPVGTERFYGNCVWVKIADENAHHSQSRFKSNCWRRKHHLVWEKYHGKISDGLEVVFLDGDSRNCDINNLTLATRREKLLAHNPLMFKSEDAVTKKAALEWSKLYLSVKDIGGVCSSADMLL